MDWLEIKSGAAPLVVAFPHTGTDIPEELAGGFVSPWHARRDTDWWVDRLYAFAEELGATTIRTSISRSVIDVNRGPSGVSLYPGQATTALCPTTDFDGAPLYSGALPDEAEVARRRELWFDPYHAALAAELERVRSVCDRVVFYDAHSIRSRIPRLFEGELPQFNIGTNDGATCDPALSQGVQAVCAASGLSHVLDGRFKGGWTTRHYGDPARNVHAIQMELAIRGYLPEPTEVAPENWPPAFDPGFAAPLAAILQRVLATCLDFARKGHP
jgi:formiminoglutamase